MKPQLLSALEMHQSWGNNHLTMELEPELQVSPLNFQGSLQHSLHQHAHTGMIPKPINQFHFQALLFSACLQDVVMEVQLVLSSKQSTDKSHLAGDSWLNQRFQDPIIDI